MITKRLIVAVRRLAFRYESGANVARVIGSTQSRGYVHAQCAKASLRTSQLCRLAVPQALSKLHSIPPMTSTRMRRYTGQQGTSLNHFVVMKGGVGNQGRSNVGS